ncbi:MAG: N-acetyl-gamma-glutamyl-phosphate reductase [Arenicellales bacterium]|nr:N-acetyl-gamma-glutamyl-phosphate reductase [Arenicellales bacterium]
MIKVGIIGGTGYTGVELLRILADHPLVEITVITSRGEAGTAVDDMFPSLRGRVDLCFVAPDDAALQECDVVFSATPNGVAMTYARRLLDADVRLIDVAADFRLKDPATWQRWYGMEHQCPDLLSEAVYGLPELNREEIKKARLVANPGCYPTSICLGLLPLLENGLVATDDIVTDAKSGVSGAGRNAKMGNLFSEVADSIKAYGVPAHRHRPEINQTLSQIAAEPITITFVPHLVPMVRGIHATIYASPQAPVGDIQAIYEARYSDEPFVDVLPANSHPDTRSVRGSNTCRIAVHHPGQEGRIIVLSVIDNLVKGAAGQAVQNMNLMFDMEEKTGLAGLPLMP